MARITLIGAALGVVDLGPTGEVVRVLPWYQGPWPPPPPPPAALPDANDLGDDGEDDTYARAIWGSAPSAGGDVIPAVLPGASLEQLVAACLRGVWRASSAR